MGKCSKEQEQILINNYSTNGAQYCAEVIGKSNDTIRKKASSLGLKGLIQVKSHSSYLKDLNKLNIKYIPLEPYITSIVPIFHMCPNGHKWKVKPSNILSKKNCPECSGHGFNSTRPGRIYFVKFKDEHFDYDKLGITNRTVKERISVKDWNKFKFEILWEIYFENGREALELEKSLLKEHSSFLLNTGLLCSGNSETFSIYLEKPKL